MRPTGADPPGFRQRAGSGKIFRKFSRHPGHLAEATWWYAACTAGGSMTPPSPSTPPAYRRERRGERASLHPSGHPSRPPPSPPSGRQLIVLSSEQTLVECDEPSPPRRRRSQLALGDVVDGVYELRRVLGQGGMAQVYEARDRLLNRTVALKVSWPHIGFEPLAMEAQAMAALGGRGVPSVYALGRHGDIGYCAMERIYGRTLAAHLLQRVHDGVFTIDEVIDILLGVAAALIEVHAAGLIHRDLKPSNIMLAPGDRIVLLDFGLFASLGQAGSSHICGSPHYIAPEVITATMEASQAHLVDIYALGVIGFMLLSGHPPFDDTSVTCLLAKHVYDVPPPVTAVRPDTPPELSRLIHEMLAKEPEKRTFSAEAVVAALRAMKA